MSMISIENCGSSGSNTGRRPLKIFALPRALLVARRLNQRLTGPHRRPDLPVVCLEEATKRDGSEIGKTIYEFVGRRVRKTAERATNKSGHAQLWKQTPKKSRR